MMQSTKELKSSEEALPLVNDGKASQNKDFTSELQAMRKQLAELEIRVEHEASHDKTEIEELENMRERIELLEKGDGECLLPEDTYSFLANPPFLIDNGACNRPTHAVLIGSFVFVLQVVTLSLLAADVIDRDNEGNVLDIPSNVDLPVRLSQFIALFITVLSQDEVRQSLNVWYNGYDQDTIALELGGTASRKAWYGSATLRFATGCLGLAVTFMLVVRADTVRDLLLNFTAVEFISNVDDTVFLLSQWGYFGRSLRREAVTIADAKWPIEQEQKQGRKVRRFALLMIIWCIMIAFWSWIFYKQESSQYLDQSIYVQFGDEFSSVLGAFSGIYTVSTENSGSIGKRPEYVLTNAGVYDGTAKFGYCWERRAWTFTYDRNVTDSTSLDSCEGGMIRAFSAESFSFDITDTGTGAWFYNKDDADSNPQLQHFSLSGRTRFVNMTCEKNVDCQDRMCCSEEGRYICEPGWYGVSCQFRLPCETIEIDERFDEFTGSRSWSTSYGLVRNKPTDIPIQVYGRPMYIASEQREGVLDLILNTGRRWVLTHSGRFEDTAGKSLDDIVDFFANIFHAHWSNYDVSFISESVDVDTPQDEATPSDIHWFHAKMQLKDESGIGVMQFPDLNRKIDTVLLCAVCHNDTNPCLYSGTCTTNSRCVCANGSSGTLCQLSPDGNGQCDSFFNTPEFGFDGGDCCAETCISTTRQCGIELGTAFGLDYQKFVGYPNCIDQGALCDADMPACWKPLAQFPGIAGELSAGLEVALSGNGAVIATYALNYELELYPYSSLVRVFEQDGIRWVPRGEPLRRDLLDDFPYARSSRIALSDDGFVLALGTWDGGNGVVQVLKWTANQWRQIGANIQGSVTDPSFGSSLSLSGDGRTVAIGSLNIAGNVGVYEHTGLHEYDGVWGKNWPEFAGEEEGRWLVSLAGDGRKLAAGGSSSLLGIYEFNSTTMWVDLGPSFHNESDYCFTLSGDGSTLAVGHPFDRTISVFHFGSKNGTQHHTDITMTGGGWIGGWVALSFDGSILATGGPQLDRKPIDDDEVEIENIDSVRVYKFNATSRNWTQYGQDISGNLGDETGDVVALSNDGNTVAYGAPWDRLGLGVTKVAWNATKQATTRLTGTFGEIHGAQKKVNITVVIQLDSHPLDTELSLQCNNITVDFAPSRTLFVLNQRGRETFLIPAGAECEFTITDFAGDGLSQKDDFSRGHYRIFYGPDTSSPLVARGGGLFGSYETLRFQAAPPPPELVQVNFGVNDSEDESQTYLSLDLSCSNGLKIVVSPRIFAHFDPVTYFIPKGTDCILNAATWEQSDNPEVVSFPIDIKDKSIAYSLSLSQTLDFIVSGTG